MGRIGCFLIFAVIGLLWMGGQGVYTGLTNSKQTEMTLADYVQKKPTATWLKLKDCQVSTLDAAYTSKLGSITEVYIPLRAPGSPPEEKVHVLLATKDKATLAMIKRMSEMKNDQEMLKFAIENGKQLLNTRDVNGIVRFGIELKDKDRRKLANLDKNLTPDFVILSEGEEPHIFVSVAMVVAGLVLGLVLLVVLGSSGKSADASEEAPPTA
jgi:hypothetical protein